jgi:hypothetical protein
VNNTLVSLLEQKVAQGTQIELHPSMSCCYEFKKSAHIVLKLSSSQRLGNILVMQHQLRAENVPLGQCRFANELLKQA